MKKFKILFVFMAAVALFASCGNESEFEAPKITFNPSANPVVAEFVDGIYNVNVHVTVEAEGQIKTIEIQRYDDGDINNEVSKILTDAVDGDRGETDFTWTMKDELKSEDFTNNVRYKITVNDKEGQSTNVNYTVQKSANEYNCKFIVKCGNTVIANAIVNLGGVDLTATDENGTTSIDVEEGTYAYTVKADGYLDVEGEVTVAGENKEVNIEMTPATTPLSEYSAEIQMNWEGEEGKTYGLLYNVNTTTNAIIKAVNGAEFVELADDNYTSLEELVAAFEAGIKVTQIEQPFFYDAKDFTAKYFISYVNNTYYLIKTTEAIVKTAPNNWIKFVEKH